jgi:ankyrin repeat protein
MTALAPDAASSWWAAVEAGDLDGLRALLQKGIDPDLRDANGETALHRLAADLENEPAPENVEIARLLLESAANVNAADRDHQTPLMLAARGGSREMTALLLRFSADSDIRDDKGQTSLMHALPRAPMVGQLLDHGASLKARDLRGRTALMFAVHHAWLETVKVLLTRGADVHAADDQGETALHIAVRQAVEQEQTLQAIETDASSEQPKYAPAHRLLWLVRERADLLREIVRTLMRHGARANVPDVHGMTPMAYAWNAHNERLLKESPGG